LFISKSASEEWKKLDLQGFEVSEIKCDYKLVALLIVQPNIKMNALFKNQFAILARQN
jgi:hypothetical protein